MEHFVDNSGLGQRPRAPTMPPTSTSAAPTTTTTNGPRGVSHGHAATTASRTTTASSSSSTSASASSSATAAAQSHVFYSNPASYAPSIELAEKPKKPTLSSSNRIADSADTVVAAQNSKSYGSFPQPDTYASDAELARQLAIQENAPSDAPGSIPKALHSPYVRNQLAGLKVHRPYFLWTMTFVQVIMIVVELIVNSQKTGSIIATNPMNYMIGPSIGVIIQTGARFTPCMRPNTIYDKPGSQLQCPNGISSSTQAWSNGQSVDICTLDQICGMGGLNGQPPNQWFRFITPIFLHGGIIHLLMNLSFQCRTGFQMEQDFGWWRMGCIYLISGIGGFLFGGNYSGMSPSVGCSGALFGLIACLLIDLIQNWRLVKNPGWELAKLIFLILISFLLGTLPFLDNFAHIGGFFCGALAGLIFMPTIYYNKTDKIVKITLQIIAVPVLIIVYSLMIAGFYNVWNNCPWCKYLTCIPGFPWCEEKWGLALGP
ncbi:hypothetical protein HDU99_000176 [Rhizoclosmatium hyalinum]|nr:hypothetical protein HDU99_000176 [Rhizoclosmatium hyalinum]